MEKVKTRVQKSQVDGRLWLVTDQQYCFCLKKTERGFSAGWGQRVEYSLRRTIDGTWEYSLRDGRARTFDKESADCLESEWNLAEI